MTNSSIKNGAIYAGNAFLPIAGPVLLCNPASGAVYACGTPGKAMEAYKALALEAVGKQDASLLQDVVAVDMEAEQMPLEVQCFILNKCSQGEPLPEDFIGSLIEALTYQTESSLANWMRENA